MVLGQSNAYAHGTLLPKEEQVTEPMKNVHGLSKESNLSYDLKDVKWGGYTTCGMNLGNSWDHTCSICNYFAKMWQAAIDGGRKLPDLYIIHIAIGGQGIAQFEVRGLNMWYPFREPVIEKLEGNEYNISLYPLTTEILSLAMMNLIGAGKHPKIIGLHWNQWETDCETGSNALNNFADNLRNLMWGFCTALGSDRQGSGIPIYLYRAFCERYGMDRIQKINEIFNNMTKEYEKCKVLDLEESGMYLPEPVTKGIFLKDGVHYTPEAHKWFALQQWNDAVES